MEDFGFVSEKRKQEYSLFLKIKPQNRSILSRLITEYDLQHSSLTILRENASSYNKIKMALQKYLIEREAYLEEITASL